MDTSQAGETTTSSVEDCMYEGRTLLGHEDEQGEHCGWPEVAAEAIRAVNHLTILPAPIPAPVVYEVLGDLKRVGHGLPQALAQLATGLHASLETHDVYDTAGDPAINVHRAVAALAEAAEHAVALGERLEAAQSAIAAQGYKA